MSIVRQIWDSLVNIVYPNCCEVCGNTLVRGERYICLSCLYDMPRTKFWEKDGNEIEQLFWGKVNIEHACSLFYYRKGSAYRPMIHELKYKGKRNIGLRLGEELGLCLKNSPLYQSLSMLVPIPLHSLKEKMRGYNQSEYIAYGISKAMNLPVENRNVIRIKNTETQTLKLRTERWENVQSVFAVKDASRFDNEHILLIDDVITTGSTIESCASTILNSCKCKISIVSIGYVSS